MSSRILLTRLVSVLDLSRAYLPARALPLGAIPFSSFSTKPSSSSATTSPAAPPTVQPTEFTPNVREMTPAHITRVGELDAKMRASYDTLRTDGSVTFEEAYIKRLIFRSKQRGWLEVDLLMGAYATKFLAGKTKEELTVYERILNRETLDLYVSCGEGGGWKMGGVGGGGCPVASHFVWHTPSI